MRINLCKAVLLWIFGLLISVSAFAGDAKTVAVVVYAHGAGQDERVVTRIAQTRLEQILGDNGVTVLDQEKSQELKKSWKKLEDPGFLLTAEDFVKAAQKYKIDGIYRVYINAQAVLAPEQFYTATAHADLRFVNEDAKVTAISPVPMGTVGNPPSDGLTASAALTNAVQRAVDSSLEKAGYKIGDAVSPRKLDFELKTVDFASIGALGADAVVHRVAIDANKLPSTLLGKNVADATERTNDDLACLAQSPDKAMIAAGIRTRIQMRMNLKWRTTMRLIDAAENKQVLEFEVDTGMRHGTTKMLDCMFVNNWRYLVAVTGNTLIMWDTERGVVVSQIDLSDRSLDTAALSYYRTSHGGYLVIEGNGGKSVYQLVLKGKG